MDIDLYFGLRDFTDYRLGDLYPLKDENIVTCGGEGYAECPECHKDFFVVCHVTQGRIEQVEVDLSKNGYIP